MVGESVGRYDFKLLAHFDDGDDAAFAGKIKVASGADRRGFEIVRLRQALLMIIRLARSRVEATEHAVVGQSVEFIFMQHGRSRV